MKENTRGLKILDHICSNNLKKIQKSSVIVDTSSDHIFVQLEKKMNVIQVEDKFYLSRKWKDIDYEIMQQNMLNTEEYFLMLEDYDLNRITTNLIKLIQRECEKQAPS